MALVLFLVAHLDDARQPEVGDSQRERGRVNQDVGGLDIPVHYSASVEVAHRTHQLLHQAAHGIGAEVWFDRRGPFREVDATVLKHHVQNLEWTHAVGIWICVGLRLDDINHLDDVRVVQTPQNGDFAKDAQRILRRLEHIGDSFDDNRCIAVVAIDAPADLPVRATAHPLRNSEPARHVPRNPQKRNGA